MALSALLLEDGRARPTGGPQVFRLKVLQNSGEKQQKVDLFPIL